MKKEQFKALVREIIRETIAERKRRPAVTLQQGDKIIKFKTPRGGRVPHRDDPYDLPPSTAPVAPEVPTSKKGVFKKTQYATPHPYDAPTLSVVPPEVQAKVAQNGRVDFGKYYDSAGTYLGKVQQGEWIPAEQDSNESDNNQGKLGENKMLLKNLIRENMERRLNLMKISAIMEKVLPEVSKDQANKLSELFTEASMMATQMNMLPYTKFNLMEWKLSIGMVHSKLYELKEEIMKICEKEDRVDLMPLVRAIEEACQQ